VLSVAGGGERGYSEPPSPNSKSLQSACPRLQFGGRKGTVCMETCVGLDTVKHSAPYSIAAECLYRFEQVHRNATHPHPAD